MLSAVSVKGITAFDGNFGKFSIRKGTMSNDLLKWITNDEWMRTPAARAYPDDPDAEVKVEETYLVRDDQPLVVNGRRTSAMLFDRLRAFVLALIDANRRDFEILDERLKGAMRGLQGFEQMGANVNKLLERSLDEWLFPFASVQSLPV